MTTLTEKEATYFENVLEWAKLVGKLDMIESNFISLCEEYNQAFDKLFEKIVTMPQDKKKCLKELLAVDVYYTINKREAEKQILNKYNFS